MMGTAERALDKGSKLKLLEDTEDIGEDLRAECKDDDSRSAAIILVN
jgi:hypothetical protein